MFVSYDLRDSRGFPACRGADHIRLGSGFHAAVDPGQGLISARRSGGLDLQFRSVTEQAAWLELGLTLGGAGQGRRDRAWRGSSRFYCRLRLALQLSVPVAGAAADQSGDQSGTDQPPDQLPEPTPEVRLALRLHLPEGFEDIFAPDPLPVQQDFTCIRAEIAPPICILSQARAVDLHLFLPPRDGALQVSDFAVTAVR
ncbi:hypothetical protein [Pseudophaeobacter sp.]|uniref:hypothetical protein n=1 Tax=Pseudophaeobacter sp. TaxID=1971739 RepID=UPI003297A254